MLAVAAVNADAAVESCSRMAGESDETSGMITGGSVRAGAGALACAGAGSCPGFCSGAFEEQPLASATVSGTARNVRRMRGVCRPCRVIAPGLT